MLLVLAVGGLVVVLGLAGYSHHSSDAVALKHHHVTRTEPHRHLLQEKQSSQVCAARMIDG
jgi:hypothetical protein